jgi:hypothetical protein
LCGVLCTLRLEMCNWNHLQLLNKVYGFVDMEFSLSISNFDIHIGGHVSITIRPHDSTCMNSKVWQTIGTSLEVWLITNINLEVWEIENTQNSKGRRNSNVESPIRIYCKKHKFWVPFHHLNVLWSFFINQNQYHEVDMQVVQGMKSVICHNDPLLPKSLLEVL